MKLQKCPVCDGRGFVKGNFYDVAGETCSFGDYAKKECSTAVCMCCNGKGIVEFEEKSKSFRIPEPITKIEKYKGLDNQWHKNYYCPTCNRFVNENQKACSYCGQLLKWANIDI